MADNIDVQTLQSWTLQGTERLVLGEFGQSCHTACASAGLFCSDAAFPFRVLNQDGTMVRALFEAVGVQCSYTNSVFPSVPGAGTNTPAGYFSYNFDSMGAQTLNYVRCYYGYRVVPPGSTLSNVIPNCGASTGSSWKRLCPCGRY